MRLTACMHFEHIDASIYCGTKKGQLESKLLRLTCGLELVIVDIVVVINLDL